MTTGTRKERALVALVILDSVAEQMSHLSVNSGPEYYRGIEQIRKMALKLRSRAGDIYDLPEKGTKP